MQIRDQSNCISQGDIRRLPAGVTGGLGWRREIGPATGYGGWRQDVGRGVGLASEWRASGEQAATGLVGISVDFRDGQILGIARNTGS